MKTYVVSIANVRPLLREGRDNPSLVENYKVFVITVRIHYGYDHGDEICANCPDSRGRITPRLKTSAGTFFLATCVLFFTLLSFTNLLFAGGQGFRTEHLLQDHFEKYGREFSPISRQQYLRLAQQLRDTHPGRNILESRRPDGLFKFDRKHGYFGAYDTDGTIRTFFIPPDGIRYFERQAG